MRVNSDGARIGRAYFDQFFQLASDDWAPNSGDAIADTFAPLLIMNPAGAVNIKMPTSNAARKGLCFLVVNKSGSTITFQTDGGAGFTTAITVATTKCALLVCTGDSTQAVGWRAFAGA